MEGLHKINKENNIEKIKILKENLKEIFDPSKCTTFGHGTTHEEKAESILINGIESSTNALDETALILNDTNESYNKILNWKHKNSKYIIVIMIPTLNSSSYLESRIYTDNIFDELPEDRKSNTSHYGRGFGKEYYIKPQFIKGYINVNSLNFVKNKLYNPEEKVKIKKIPEMILGRRNALRTSGLSEEEIDKLMKPSPSVNNSESDTDWE